MRVAVIAEHVEPGRGGAETSTLQFLAGLAQAGVAVTLYTRREPPPLSGVDVRIVRPRTGPGSRRTPAFAAAVARREPHRDSDLVHAITPCLGATLYQPRGGAVPEVVARNVALRRRALSRGWKRATTAMLPHLHALLRLERRMMTGPAAPLVLALSHYVVDQFRRHYGVHHRIARVFNGVDVPPGHPHDAAAHRRAVRARFNLADTATLCLMVAHNLRLKGLDRWLEAQALLAYDGDPVHTVVVGGTPDRRYRQAVTQLGLMDCVHFAGAASPITPYYHAADVLVHPTYYDPCSRVVLEAMLCGLPCLTTRFNGAAEALRHGVDGWVVHTPDDVAALAAGARAARHPAFRAALLRDHDRLRRDLGMARHVREVLAIYERQLESQT